MLSLEHFCLCPGSITLGSRTMRTRVTKGSLSLTSLLSEKKNLKIAHLLKWPEAVWHSCHGGV